MAKLVVEIRKKGDKGERYPPATLYQLCCALLRFLRNNGRPALNIFEDPTFKHFHDTLDAEMKRLTGQGVGANVRQAAAFSEEQEERLWNLNLLGANSASTLLNTMVFLIGKNFSLRSGKEHRCLKFTQLTLEPACGDEPEKLIYTSFGEKNNLGGIKHRTFKRKRIEHYANETCGERCMVYLYKKYLEKCLREAIVKDIFYLAPRRKYSNSDEVWFTSNPVGHNTLGDTVKNMCREAGIQGYYTNHSLRTTTATRALEKGIPEKFIMQRTGHRDVRSLQQYQRPTVEKKVEISKAFDLPLADKVKSNCEEASVRKEVGKRETCSVEIGGEIEKKVESCGVKSSEKKGTQFSNCTFYVGNDFKV